MARIYSNPQVYFLPSTAEVQSDADVVNRVCADLTDHIVHPRVPLPEDHPARLPAGRVARWWVLAGMRLRSRERDVAERLHRWLEERYEFWLD